MSEFLLICWLGRHAEVDYVDCIGPQTVQFTMNSLKCPNIFINYQNRLQRPDNLFIPLLKMGVDKMLACQNRNFVILSLTPKFGSYHSWIIGTITSNQFMQTGKWILMVIIVQCSCLNTCSNSCSDIAKTPWTLNSQWQCQVNTRKLWFRSFLVELSLATFTTRLNAYYGWPLWYNQDV